MPDQVPDAVKRARSRGLHALGMLLKPVLLKRQLGRREPLLMEGISSDEAGPYRACYTPNYLPVRLRHPDATSVDRIVTARLLAVSTDGEAIDAVPD
jgi:threonylcarbamoyladenosine tRNA methylthiotransferase MtaB